MRCLVRCIIDDHVGPTGLIQEVTVDIDRITLVGCDLMRATFGLRSAAIEIEIGRRSVVAPVIYVETQITGGRDTRNKRSIIDLLGQGDIIPDRVASGIHITVLPVKHRRVRTFVTGDLRSDEFELQFIITLHTEIQGYRILRDEAVEQAIHKLGSCTGEVERMSGFFQTFFNQFADRFLSIVRTTSLVDRACTIRNLVGHRILERKRTLNSSFTVHLILQHCAVGIDVVILDIRHADHEPVILVVTRQNIVHIRNQQFCLLLVRIRSNRSIGIC